jgi:hypothetical protein
MENQIDNILLTDTLADMGSVAANKIDIAEMTKALADVTVPQIVDLVAEAAAVERGASVAIALKFNEQMDIDWFDCKYREISDENKIWEPVRSELSKSLLAKQHSNPAQFIKRVKAHGRGLRHGYPVENSEGSGQEDGAKNRAPFDRVEQELGKLYKYLNNPSNDETIKADPQFKKLSKANESITKILRDDLGIDLNRYSNAD